MTTLRLPDGRVSATINTHLATVVINRPEKLNAIDPSMLSALRAAFEALDRTAEVRVIVVTAAGDKAFCVGADINAWSEFEPVDMWRRWVRDGNAVMDLVAAVRQPVIAAINGLALGGGLELALACDLRVCVPHARFGSPEVQLGTLPGWGGTTRLAEAIGPARARQLIFTGEQIDAEAALRWGLVNDIAVDSPIVELAQAIGSRIAQNAPVAVQLAKTVMDASRSGGPGTSLEAIAGALAASTDDGAEGIASFREKRSPQFEDK